MAKKPTHIHQYKRVKWGRKKTIIWRCTLTGCSHYIHNAFIEGRRCICLRCHQSFVMTKDKMRRDKPKCDACQSRGNPVITRLDEILQGL